MSNNFDHFDDIEFEELKKVFYSQAYETVDNLQDLLLTLESTHGDENALKTIKRYIHTLKGDSNSFGLVSVGTVCHSIEDILSGFMNGSGHTEKETVNLLLSSVDTISKLLIESEAGTNGTDIKDILREIDLYLEKGEKTSENMDSILQNITRTEYQELQAREAIKEGLNVYEVEVVFDPMCREKSVGVFMLQQRFINLGQIIHSAPDIDSDDIEKADRMVLLFSTGTGIEDIRKDVFIPGITKALDFVAYTSRQDSEAGIQNMEKPISSDNEIADVSRIKSEILKIDVSKVDKVMNLVGELIIGRSVIDQIAKDIEANTATADIADRLFAANSYMERTVMDLQKGIMKMRMVPINQVFRKFPKIVRDLAAERNKQVRLDIEGKETEIDKSIVDVIGEPLAHIIRNLIDHGIEEPESRRSKGKPEEGVIKLRAYHEASQIVIEASDDGHGIDREKLRKKAVEGGFLTTAMIEKMSEAESLNLIFVPGLSTSETVSEISGRGIGMDAVKAAVEGMKGSIEVESTLDKGTIFRIRLPLTLAVIKALLFEVGRKLYAVPISVISEVTRIMLEDLITVDGRNTLLLRDQIISIIHIQELFNISTTGNKKKFILILRFGGRKVGLLVDHLIGQQELVVKAVNTDYTQSGLVTGASILGDGRVVLILYAPAIFGMAVAQDKNKAVAV